MKEELAEAKRLLQERVHTFRNELVEDMRAHEVFLLPRPTSAEKDDPKCQCKRFRRPHHRVIVGSDDKEIRKMPNHKLCISEDLKRSLSKMRENLFQRRLNLAVYEKTIGDWTLPSVRAEVRRRQRLNPTASPARSSRLVPVTASLQTPGHGDLASTSDSFGANAGAAAATAAPEPQGQQPD
jgi:hypothetical protein